MMTIAILPNKLLRDLPKEEKGKAAASLKEEVEALLKVKAKANPEDDLKALAKARVKERIVRSLEIDPRRKARAKVTLKRNHVLSLPRVSATEERTVGIYMILRARRQTQQMPRVTPLSRRRRETSPNQGLQRKLVALLPSS